VTIRRTVEFAWGDCLRPARAVRHWERQRHTTVRDADHCIRQFPKRDTHSGTAPTDMPFRPRQPEQAAVDDPIGRV
jgi:hypothetical protein